MISKAVEDPFMPRSEIEHLTRLYSEASVILEYGSGGSTKLAASMSNKFVMSVESDRNWARTVRSELVGAQSRNVVFHVDIGPTGNWGRPIDTAFWRRYHLYPNQVWDQRWFRHPDTVLVDGRFRTACFATILLRCRSPVKLLFDDYTIRPKYQVIERVLKPNKIVGRMAEFLIEPGMVKSEDIGFLIQQYFTMTVDGITEDSYSV